MSEKPGIVPPAYFVSEARRAVNASLMNGRWFGEMDRRHHFESRPLTESEMQPQRDWIDKFEALVSEGKAHGWMGYDEESGPFAEPLKTQEYTRVWDESEADHAERVGLVVGGVRQDAIKIPHA